MTLLRTQLGQTLRGHRLRQRRTLRDVSGAARVSLGYLSEVERGQKEASSELLASICDALDVELADLLAEVSSGLRGPDGRLRQLATAGAGAAPADDRSGGAVSAEEAAVPADAAAPVAEPALALVGAATRAAHRAGSAVSLAA
ncbi:Helix-turn-helix domain-containing protein [Geodermatophilus amargosae]|uniref:Helix-turn-helix domain-containing protein n=1 Tax=Geodermatophilus amargosae TaxID=1296565 RepID=A0A1I6ZRP6_9ACTN|nr:helix-turn-helix transcriptional regulator [Geodermatophilus amargosae]SFT65245.1 Helix-turn-helix domain-containing protein [Geodermatophilus amargosae]